MIAVVIRCQSYPGTFQFAAARLSGGSSTQYEGLAAPALGGIAHTKFEHAGRSCAIFVANTVARVSGEPGEGLAAARGLRGLAVNRNHGRLPALNFSRRFRSLEYIPIKLFSDHIAQGWTLASELKPGDYAAVMRPPSEPMSNKKAGFISRGVKYAGHDKSEGAL